MNKNIFHLNLGALLRHTASMVCTLIILGCPNDMASPLLETIEQRVAATKIGTLASPVLSLPEGTYSGAQLIAISCSTPGAKLRYTLDGTNPTATKGVLYTMPVGIDSTKTLKVVSFLESGAVSSVVSAEFRITIPQTDKAIVAFSILSTSGIIDELAKTITLSLPYGSVLTDLVAQFTLSASYCKINSTIQESGFTHNDFTKPVVYRVYAEDNSTADYTVTVTVALNPAKELLSFSIKDCDDVATINQETGSITMSLPYGTPLSSLIAVFQTSGAVVKIGSQVQVSGSTSNFFTSARVYTVFAEDGTSRDYTVTVSVRSMSLQALPTSASRHLAALACSSDGNILVIAEAYGFLQRSSDFGTNWNLLSGAGAKEWRDIASSSDGTKLAAVAMDDYIYTSSNSGSTWTCQTGSGARAWKSIACTQDGSSLAAAVQGGYIYVSTDSGATWTEKSDSGARNWSDLCVSTTGAAGTLKIAASVNGGYIYTSTNAGTKWTERNSSGTRSWVGISGSDDLEKLVALVANGYAYTSVNFGIGWTQRGNPDYSRQYSAVACSQDGNTIFAVENNGHLFRSTDGGINWTIHNPPSSRWTGLACSSNGSKVAIVNYDGLIYKSSDKGFSWTNMTLAGRKWSAISSSSNGSMIYACVEDGYIFASSDAGLSWTAQRGPGAKRWTWIDCSSDGTKVAACAKDSNIFTSGDSGATWTRQDSSGIRSWQTVEFSADASKMAASTSNASIYQSSNDGLSWTLVPNSSFDWKPGLAISNDGQIIIAAQANPTGNVHKTINTGMAWTYSMQGYTLAFFASSANCSTCYLVTGTNNNTFKTTNGTSSWTVNSGAGKGVLKIVTCSPNGTNVAVAESPGSVFTSVDSAFSWKEVIGSGGKTWKSLTLSADGLTLYAAEADGLIYQGK